MNRIVFKVAASTLVLGLTMVSCRSDTAVIRSAADAATAGQQAAAAQAEARHALESGNVAGAIAGMETAVSLSPRDAGYRLLLADLYMKAGRFESARATYSDVIEIDPENARASLALALTQIALGSPQGAVAQLDRIAGRAPAADVGLAYALAGQPERGIELLEPAARSLTASARLRQNLALAYAMAGNWERARIVAAQDLSPAEVGPRLRQWATLNQPEAASSQLVQLLGVAPAADPGQPARLALHRAEVPQVETAQVAEPVQHHDFARVEYAGAPVPPPQAAVTIAEEIPAVEPDSPAALQMDAVPSAEPAKEPVKTFEQRRYAAAAESLTRPEPTVIQTAIASAVPPPPVFKRAEPEAVQARPEPRPASGRYVVQIGAFSTPENAERAWIAAERRFGLRMEQPLTTTIDLDGRILHRVSVAGFENQAEAKRLCGSIKSRGGECFVRTTAGDAPVRWAARYVRNG